MLGMLAQIKKVIWPRANSQRPHDETYAILQGHTEQYGEIALRGPLAGLMKGDWIEIVQSSYEPNAKHGATIHVQKFKRAIPDRQQAGPDLAASWLASRIPGVGPKIAQQIVKEVGIAKLLDNPELLRGYLPARFQDEAVATWSQINDTLALDSLLESVGVAGKRRENLIRQMGGPHATLSAIKEDPWEVGRKFPNLTFPTCEKLAELLQCDMRHPSRISAGCLFWLERRSQDKGDIIHPTEEITSVVVRKLKLSREDAVLVPPAMAQNPEIASLGPKFVATANLYDSEKSIHYTVKQLMDESPLGINPKLVTDIAKSCGLDDTQTTGLHIINENAISALTGGPGTGKTTTLGVFVKMCRMSGKKLVLVAPTGKAARRLSTVADHPTSTIHRWIAQVEAGRSEEADMVIIDESSMISSTLMAKLLKTVASETGRCVLVGDVNQLPPVEPGSPFKDLLHFSALPVVSLKKIWRQTGDSMIPIVAAAITKGLVPSDVPKISRESKGWRYIECETGEQVEREAAIESLRQHRKYGLDGSAILSPHYKEAAGVNRLGTILQNSLNRNPRRYYKGELGEFRTGDPVLHVGNKYSTDGTPDLTHAMLGHVTDIRLDNKTPMIVVEWEDGATRTHPIPEGHASDVVLGYAFTYHRSQGSEYPGVVVALAALPNRLQVEGQENQLNLGIANREAVYTAITRAKEEVVLVAQAGVLAKALAREGSKRRTALASLLRKDRRNQLEAA
jgi:exodeoxyribonuclease V alpha subunit